MHPPVLTPNIQSHLPESPIALPALAPKVIKEIPSGVFCNNVASTPVVVAPVSIAT
jgi:hypothetical protein